MNKLERIEKLEKELIEIKTSIYKGLVEFNKDYNLELFEDILINKGLTSDFNGVIARYYSIYYGGVYKPNYLYPRNIYESVENYFRLNDETKIIYTKENVYTKFVDTFTEYDLKTLFRIVVENHSYTDSICNLINWIGKNTNQQNYLIFDKMYNMNLHIFNLKNIGFKEDKMYNMEFHIFNLKNIGFKEDYFVEVMVLKN